MLFSILALSFVRFSFYELLDSIAKNTHSFCLNFIPKDSEFITELNALVCAENFSSLNSSHLYISSGLIHLFVVSGAHLLFIEKIFSKLSQKNRKLQWVLLGILITYGFACSLNPPIVRSLFSCAISIYLSQKNSLGDKTAIFV